MKCLRSVLVAVAVAAPAPLLAAPAEEAVPHTAAKPADAGGKERRAKRFRFRASLLSYGFNASAASVEAGMSAAGLNRPFSFQSLDADAASLVAPLFEIFGLWDSAWGGSVTTYPYSTFSNHAPQSFTVGYRLKPGLELSVLVDRERRRLGDTAGRAEPGVFLHVSREMRSSAALVSYAPPESPLRAGLGVSLNSLRIQVDRATQSRNRLGLLGEVALAVPARSRVFVDTALQYRWVASPKIGPIPVTDERGVTITTFPSTPVSFSRWTVSLGVGFRL